MIDKAEIVGNFIQLNKVREESINEKMEKNSFRDFSGYCSNSFRK